MDTSSHPLRLRNTGTPIQVDIDGVWVSALAGDSVATILMAGGQRVLTASSADQLARSVFCGMGLCHQCLVVVDGVRDVRACMTPVRPGMQIRTGQTRGEP